VATNAAAVKGEALPVSKEFGEIKLTVSRFTPDEDDLGLVYDVEENGKRADGWRLIEREVVDGHGLDVVECGRCREETSVNFRAMAVRDQDAAPVKWTVSVPKLPKPGEFMPLEAQTNLCGMDLQILGVVGTGSTRFELPILRSESSISISGDDNEIEVRSNKVRIKAKERLLVASKGKGADQVTLYLRGVGDSEDQSLGQDFQVDSRTTLLFIPVGAIEKKDGIEVAFSADKKIPVEFSIETPATSRISDARTGR
jgi:hypothetical protein